MDPWDDDWEEEAPTSGSRARTAAVVVLVFVFLLAPVTALLGAVLSGDAHVGFPLLGLVVIASLAALYWAIRRWLEDRYLP